MGTSCYLWIPWQPFRNEMKLIFLVHRTYINNLVPGTNKPSVNSIIIIIIIISSPHHLHLLNPHSRLQTCWLYLLNICLLLTNLMLPLNLNAHHLSPGELSGFKQLPAPKLILLKSLFYKQPGWAKKVFKTQILSISWLQSGDNSQATG